jgi:uncharacterized membrane protein
VSEFLLAAYNREDSAAYALSVLRAHSDDLPLDLDSTAIVRVGEDGRYTVTTTGGAGTRRTSSGLLWGALFELVFLVPVAGVAYGASVGSMFGALDRAGLDADVRARMREMLVPRTSGLAFFAIEMDPEPSFSQLSVPPSSVLRVALSVESDRELAWELGGEPTSGRRSSAGST